MKRFFFWCVVGLAALALVRDSSRSRTESRRIPRGTVVHRAGGPDGRRVLIVEREGGKVISIDGQGVTVIQDGREDDDERDRDRDRERLRLRRSNERLPERVFVDDLPVPVVPGSRVTEAQIGPPRPPVPPEPPKPPSVRVRRHVVHAPTPPKPPAPPEPPVAPVTIKGRRSATEARARDDARALFVEEVRRRLEPDVPRDWPVPDRFTDGFVREVKISPIERDYGTVYEAVLTAEFGPKQRAQVVEAYRHEKTVEKLGVLGALFLFVLVCLATVSGYIRADEATKGYYTNRLRLAAAAAAGAAGVVVYRWLA